MQEIVIRKDAYMHPFRTGFVFDEHFLAHDTGMEAVVEMRAGSFSLSPEPHPSSLAITKRIKEFLDGSGLTAQMLPLAARVATEMNWQSITPAIILQASEPVPKGGQPAGRGGKWM